MPNSLSIRRYSRQRQRHAHPFHQLVLPLQGVIRIELAGFTGKVAVGECVVIPAGEAHDFRADEAARFMVADLDSLPAGLLALPGRVFAVSPPLQAYLTFVECQLQHQLDPGLESALLPLFCQLLARQAQDRPRDPRIRAVQAVIAERLAEPLTIAELAAVACLSPTQFKKLFTAQLDLSVHQYLIRQRMEKARALLTHTDLPVQQVAEQVGYGDVSAFSRRFTRHVGLSPRQFRG